MNERNVFDLSPQLSGASEDLFRPQRLFLLVTLLAAMLIAATGSIGGHLPADYQIPPAFSTTHEGNAMDQCSTTATSWAPRIERSSAQGAR